MKIVYLHQYFTLPSANGGTRSYDISKKLIESGHNIVMITSSANIEIYSKSKWTIKKIDNIELHILNCSYNNKMSFIKRIISFIKFTIYSSIHILRIKGDIVIASSTPITIGIPALVKNFVSKTPFIFETRDVWPEVPIAMGIIKNKLLIKLLYAFEKYIYVKANHIIVLSSDMYESINNRYSLGNKMTTIPNISELSRFTIKKKENSYLSIYIPDINKKKVILYAGTFGYVNGLSYLVNLAHKVLQIDPSICFAIIGTGIEHDKIVKEAIKKGILNNNFFIIPPVPKDCLPSIYSECTIASSWVIDVKELWANSANKFFDCLAASKPILINHYGWQHDLIVKENIGSVLNPSIDKVCVEKFVDYINNEDLLKQQSINARNVAEKEFSLEVAMERYNKILDSII